MNIFILDEDPVKAATCQMDKHTVCMPREATEMLVMISETELVRYAPNHKKHPCTLWAARSRDNFMWLHSHAMALFSEYTARYGRKHNYEDIADYLATYQISFPETGLKPFAQCMPDEFKVKDDAVTAYQGYYHSKAHIATWKRNKPLWWCGA